MSMRLESISAGRNWQASAMRNPPPYMVISTARYCMSVTESSRALTSVPLMTSGEEEIRAYLMHRIERKCSHETYRQVWAGLKFLYSVTLRRPIEVEHIPFRRKPPRLPQVISGTEVSALGKYRWFLFRWNPLRDEQGRVARWYAAATDIEDRKQAE